MQATITNCCPCTRQPMSQKFVWATCLISGRSAPVRRTNGESAYALRQGAAPLPPPRRPAAAAHRSFRRCPDRAARGAARMSRRSKLLFNFGCMTMREYSVGGNAAVALRKVRAFGRRFARARHTGFRIDDDARARAAMPRRAAAARGWRQSGNSPGKRRVSRSRAPADAVRSGRRRSGRRLRRCADTTAARNAVSRSRNAPDKSNTRVPRSGQGGGDFGGKRIGQCEKHRVRLCGQLVDVERLERRVPDPRERRQPLRFRST